jgi:uncharacterized RDD family membrane protein YckC
MDADSGSQEIKSSVLDEGVADAMSSLSESPKKESGSAPEHDGGPIYGKIRPASVLRRGLAYFIDIMIFNGIVFWQTSGYRDGGESTRSLIVAAAIYFLVYFPVLEGFAFHATIGKSLMGIKVVDRSGRGIKIVRAFSRHFCKLFFGLPTIFLSWFFAGIHPKGQAVHDMIAKSYVVLRSAR